ncbi:YchJ family metal-binding protein [Janibacter anophelis]
MVDGGVDDATGVVDFVARHEGGELAERSEFTRRGGRWFYTKEIR